MWDDNAGFGDGPKDLVSQQEKKLGTKGYSVNPLDMPEEGGGGQFSEDYIPTKGADYPLSQMLAWCGISDLHD